MSEKEEAEEEEHRQEEETLTSCPHLGDGEMTSQVTSQTTP